MDQKLEQLNKILMEPKHVVLYMSIWNLQEVTKFHLGFWKIIYWLSLTSLLFWASEIAGRQFFDSIT